MGRNYTKGIIGAFIGGLIASIPWILLYIYGGMMSSYFAFIIGIGALKGYQYKGLTIKYTNNVHDRYIIIDKNKLYHLGHSIKDLGKKIFSISESDSDLIIKLLSNI